MIGREFGRELIAAVAGLPDAALAAAPGQLMDAERPAIEPFETRVPAPQKSRGGTRRHVTSRLPKAS